jgi:hypothetical protein
LKKAGGTNALDRIDKYYRIVCFVSRVYCGANRSAMEGSDMNNDFVMCDTPDFNPDGTVYDDHGQVVPGVVVTLHNEMIKVLRKTYPAFADYWKVRVDTRGGIVQIWNLALSGDWGIELKITSVDMEMRRVREEAGKMFEIFNVARGRQLSISQAMAYVEADRLGRLKHKV